MKGIKIGIIGCGKQAPKHISGLKKQEDVTLVLADVVPQAAEELAVKKGLPWISDVDNLLSDPSVDAVDICTPTPTHAQIILKALSSNKDFFCEKPLCENMAEAKKILDQVKNGGRIAMIGYVYRFCPVFEFGKKLFDGVAEGYTSPALGRLMSAFFRLGGRGSHQAWKHLRDFGGGAINEMLVHMIDLAIWYFGPIIDCEVISCDILRDRRIIRNEEIVADAEDYIMVRLDTKSGLQVFCQADLVTPSFTQYIEIQGENGTFMASIQPDMPSFLFCMEASHGYQAGKSNLNFGTTNLYEAQMAHFVDCVRTRSLPTKCTIQDAINVMNVQEKVRKGINN